MVFTTVRQPTENTSSVVAVTNSFLEIFDCVIMCDLKWNTRLAWYEMSAADSSVPEGFMGPERPFDG